MEILLPLVVIGLLVLVPLGFFLARRDTGSGPHPEDTARPRE